MARSPAAARDSEPAIRALENAIARIKKFREAANLTQEDAAHAAHISVKTLQAIEGGRAPNTSLATIACIADALGVKIGKLVD